MRVERKLLARSAALVGTIGLTVGLLATSPSLAASNGQAEADELRATTGSTAAIVVTKEGDSIEGFGSGTAQLGTDDLPTADDQFRVGSNTKMFVATVLLQLVDEGKLDLDAPIADYLPGVVTGEGIDEKRITVRQLLQHTSGLAPFPTTAELIDPSLQAFPPTPEQMVSLGLRYGSQSKPGTNWAYSNTGYMVLGLLVEKLTGQRIGAALDERVIEPLGLTETSYAYAGEKQIEGDHVRGYWGDPLAMVDVTGYEPGIWAGAGALVSSGSDLTTYTEALVDGELMSKASLTEMRKTFEDSHYGLGLLKADLSCGTAWGHNGLVAGYLTFAMSDGERSVFTAVNFTPLNLSPSEATMKQALRIIDTEICGGASDGKVLDAGTSKALESELGIIRELDRTNEQPPAIPAQ